MILLGVGLWGVKLDLMQLLLDSLCSVLILGRSKSYPQQVMSSEVEEKTSPIKFCNLLFLKQVLQDTENSLSPEKLLKSCRTSPKLRPFVTCHVILSMNSLQISLQNRSRPSPFHSPPIFLPVRFRAFIRHETLCINKLLRRKENYK